MISKTFLSDIFPETVLFQREDRWYQEHADLSPSFLEARKRVFSRLPREVWEEVISLFHSLPLVDIPGYEVRNGVVSTLQSSENEGTSNLFPLIKALVPWRKGPWNIGNCLIDAEWRSEIKYDGIQGIISSHPGASILDIGSGNGYYGFRALEDGAGEVICLDPSEKFFFQFELFQKFAQEKRIQFELLGYQFARELPSRFDMVLCMGVLYHQKNPFEVLDCARHALKKDGVLILESMTYPSTESVSFTPFDRYAKARNVYFLPSSAAMVSMCALSGFKDMEILFERKSSIEEQRTTELAPYESLVDFLDPEDHSKTIEGYPAPQRAVLIARKK
jgi:tRNA (mo5U34)-methyltransferase